MGKRNDGDRDVKPVNNMWFEQNRQKSIVPAPKLSF